MFYRVSRIIFSLLVIFHNSCTIVGTLLSKENEKLSENGPLQMCIDSFDIYKDKIIRTQDSQVLGAKYLNEVDLDSRQECLRLCCETDECDVFIFEEKKPGSCYLFHCGRPHDFKCKFTSHANYSSAVLMNVNYRATAQLEEQIRRTQQEHELKSLRKLSEPAAPLEYAYTEAPPIPVTQAPKNLVLTTPAPVKAGCSRNQYECRTSGDCIAIYNVCDGIPQCTDGSDEASDLGCPTERPTIPSAPKIHEAPAPHNNPQILNKYPPNLPHRKTYPPIYANEHGNSQKTWQVPILQHQMNNPQQQTNLQYAEQQGVIPQVNYGPQGYVGGWDYRQIYENKEPYKVPNQLHPKNEIPAYEQDQPRIFKHKSPSVVVESAGREGNGYIDPNRPYGPYYPLQNRVAWQEGQLQIPSQQPELLATVAPKVHESRPVVIQEDAKTTAAPVACKPSLNEVIDKSTKEKNIERKEHEVRHKAVPIEKAKDQAHAAKSEVHENAAVPKITSKIDDTRDHDEHKKENHEEHEPEVRTRHFVAEHLQQNNHKFDNDILRPKGAVISLALGLTATAIMAALIACRLRVVRRRGRRGHGPYAHDADYLVNGMYL